MDRCPARSTIPTSSGFETHVTPVFDRADAELLTHLTEDERMWPGYDLPLEVTQTPQRRSPRLAISVIALIVI